MLARIARELKRHGITQHAVAAEASKTSPRGSVSRTMVCHWLKGHTVSANLLTTSRRMIAVAKARLTAA